MLYGGVAACQGMVCVLFAVLSATLSVMLVPVFRSTFLNFQYFHVREI